MKTDIFKTRVGSRIGATVLKYRHTQLEYKTALEITCRHSGLMGSALDSRSSDPGFSPGRGHCVVFLDKTLTSHSASLHAGV